MRLAKVFRYVNLTVKHPEMLWAWWRKRVGGMETIEILYLECAGLCNIDCRFCFSRHTPEHLGLMSRETFSAVARQLFPYSYAVNFVGYGEPLINDALPWMIRVAKSYDREIHMTTNGILLDEGRICELIGAGVDSIAVSLDGAIAETHDENRGKGTYGKTVRNLEILGKVKEKMGLTRPLLIIDTLLTRVNSEEIPELLRLAHRMDAAAVNLAHLQACSEAEAGMSLEGETLEMEYREWKRVAKSLGIGLRLPDEFGNFSGEGCFWEPNRRIAVSWDGEVRPCCFLLHSNKWYKNGRIFYADAPRFGNIREESFVSIWRSEPYARFREQVAEGKDWPAPCKPCLLRSR